MNRRDFLRRAAMLSAAAAATGLASGRTHLAVAGPAAAGVDDLSLIHISEPTRPY